MLIDWEWGDWQKSKYMSASINQWQSSSGDTISKCGNKTSATARLRGNNKYLEATSNISSACWKHINVKQQKDKPLLQKLYGCIKTWSGFISCKRSVYLIQQRTKKNKENLIGSRILIYRYTCIIEETLSYSKHCRH